MRPGERQRVLKVVVLTAVQCLRGHVGEGWCGGVRLRRSEVRLRWHGLLSLHDVRPLRAVLGMDFRMRRWRLLALV
jgi:hypothetical protein